VANKCNSVPGDIGIVKKPTVNSHLEYRGAGRMTLIWILKKWVTKEAHVSV
jgi:hypothetical protein